MKDSLADIGTLDMPLPVVDIFNCIYYRGVKGKSLTPTERTVVQTKNHFVIGILSADKKTLQWDYAVDKQTFHRMIVRGIVQVLPN